jgi:lipopolysaccharide export system protein LptA
MRHFLLLIFLLNSHFLWAQKTRSVTKTDTLFRPFAPNQRPDTGVRKLEILRAGRYNFLQKDSATELVSLAIDVALKQSTTLFYCDSVVLNQISKIAEAFGHVHINESDTINTYADYMKYFSRERKAILRKNVRLVNRTGTLNTEELDYDLNTKIGVYKNGGRLVNGSTILTSREGTYYGETKDVIFRKEVYLNSPEYKLITDSLHYNTSTEIATFVTKTTILQGKRKIYTSSGFYNLKTGEAYFGERAVIRDSGTLLVGDKVRFDKKNNAAQATGNVIYQDSVNNFTILAGDLKSNNETKSFLATVKPLMIIKQDKDSIYISADTLFSGQLSTMKRTVVMVKDTVKNRKLLNNEDSSTNRFFEGYHNVRIFSDSVQAAGDSMFYSYRDSVFRLYKNPVVWGNSSQVTGDTIYLFTENKKPKRMYVFENALAVNKVGPDYYNQVRGNTINAWFKDGNIDYLRAKTNAESIYFAQDENNKFVGVNKATSDVIDMYFKERAANRVVFRNNLKGTTFPVRRLSSSDMKMRNFQWLEDRRPKSKFEMYGSVLGQN